MFRNKLRLVGIVGLVALAAIGFFASPRQKPVSSSDFSDLAMGKAILLRSEYGTAANSEFSGQSSIHKNVAQARCDYSWSVDSALKPDTEMLEAELKKQRGIELKNVVKRDSGFATDYRTEKGGNGTASFHIEESGDHWKVRCSVVESLGPQ